jgi:hypothetical protein
MTFMSVSTVGGNPTSDMMRTLDAMQDKHLSSDPLYRVGLSRERVRELTLAMHRKRVAEERWKRNSEPLDQYVLNMTRRHGRMYVRELAQLTGESSGMVAGAFRQLKRIGAPLRRGEESISHGAGAVKRVYYTWEGDPDS